MIWKQNTIGITKKDILSLINIVKDVSAINKDNTLDDDTKDRRVFGTLEDFSTIVDDCDIINHRARDAESADYVNIKIIEEL